MAVDLAGASRNGCAKMRRLLLLAFVVIGLGPGTFMRTATGARGDVAVVTVTPITAGDQGLAGTLRQTGMWQLASPHGWFGGFSALVQSGPRGLIAGTDRGFLLNVDVTGTAPQAVPGSFRFVGRRAGARKEVVDLEALARDPASGNLWAAFENFNTVERFAPDGRRTHRRPLAIATWSRNSGAETMVRLTDGRFLMLAEGTERGSTIVHQGLLFPGDPVEPVTPLAFRFIAPPDYDPVDATQLPDGRVLILLRRVEYTVPARFDTTIAVADPRRIRADATWRPAIIQRLSDPIYGENFEGIAFIPDPADPARGSIWLIADDNFSVFQRSLLLRFAWDEAAAPAP